MGECFFSNNTKMHYWRPREESLRLTAAEQHAQFPTETVWILQGQALTWNNLSRLWTYTIFPFLPLCLISPSEFFYLQESLCLRSNWYEQHEHIQIASGINSRESCGMSSPPVEMLLRCGAVHLVFFPQLFSTYWSEVIVSHDFPSWR